MTTSLARLVAQANVERLAVIGLAKNVGKTTVTNHLLETFAGENLYHATELALTSLGLDGEATDALTGLPKPRYVPQAGLLVATIANLLQRAESEGAQFEYLLQLPGRTALGPVVLARVLRPGRIIIAGPTLLTDLRDTLDIVKGYNTRLSIVDGAINRLGAASADITDACIVCTGASAGTAPAQVARRTADLLARLAIPQTSRSDVYSNMLSDANQRRPGARLLAFPIEHSAEETNNFLTVSMSEPAAEAQWIIEQLQCSQQQTAFFLKGAFTEELSRELLIRLSQQPGFRAELVVKDATKIFCHSAVLERLATRGLHIRVVNSIRTLAITINPYTPEYQCTAQQLLDALVMELPVGHPPVIDVVSGLTE